MRFEHPEYFWLLWGFVPCTVLYFIFIKRRNANRKRSGGLALNAVLPMQSNRLMTFRFALILIIYYPLISILNYYQYYKDR